MRAKRWAAAADFFRKALAIRQDDARVKKLLEEAERRAKGP